MEIHLIHPGSRGSASCPGSSALAVLAWLAANPQVSVPPQEAAGGANASLDDHERRISHSLYGGLDGLDDNLVPRQGPMPRTVGKACQEPWSQGVAPAPPRLSLCHTKEDV